MQTFPSCYDIASSTSLFDSSFVSIIWPLRAFSFSIVSTFTGLNPRTNPAPVSSLRQRTDVTLLLERGLPLHNAKLPMMAHYPLVKYVEDLYQCSLEGFRTILYYL
jgi:hypothetical protein